MKKKIVAVAVMMMMAVGLMPITQVHAANVEGELILDADRTEQIVVLKDKTLTLDLNGHNLTVENMSAIVNYGTLTIKNSNTSNLGTVSATGSLAAAVATTPGSHTYIQGGNFTADQWYVIKNLGSMVLSSNGTYTSGSGMKGASTIVSGYYDDSSSANDTVDGKIYTYAASNTVADLTVNGGTFIGNLTSNDTTLDTTSGTAYTSTSILASMHSSVVVNNATIRNANNGFYTDANASMVINNATASARKRMIYADNGSTITVSGGTFSPTGGTVGSTTYPGYSLVATKNGTVNVYNGTFNGAVDTNDTTGKFNVFGGTFHNVNGTVYNASNLIKAPTTFDTATGTAATKTISTITKYILYSSVPEPTTFYYKITNVANNETGDTVIQTASTSGSLKNEEVRDGVNPSAVKFVASNATTTSLDFTVNEFNGGQAASSLASLGVTDSGDDRNYVAKPLILDFSGVHFDNPGIFRYALTETSTNEKVPASGVLYFDVWVTRGSADSSDAKYGTLSVSSVIAHTDTALTLNTSSSNAVSNKTTFLKSVSVAKAMNLTVKHYAIGNQASKTEKFKYTLTLRDATHGSTIQYVKKDGTKGSIAVGSDGTSTYDFYLSDKEAITFINISEYPGYTISADEATLKTDGLKTATKLEYYQPATTALDSTTNTIGTTDPNGSTGRSATAISNDADTLDGDTTSTTPVAVTGALASQSVTTSSYVVTDDTLSTNTTVVFSVYKQGTIPTGVILSVAPYAVVVLAGFFGLIVFALKRKNKDEEEA